MYRQLLVLPEDRRYQHILWRESQDSLVETFKLKTFFHASEKKGYAAIVYLKIDSKIMTKSRVAPENSFSPKIKTLWRSSVE